MRSSAAEHDFATCDAVVNLADSPAAGSVYLTVTGTSAEAGDDGQVGRGNRINGLITPCRPMSLEAAAGKNPVSHVGKIYNVVAHQIAEALAATSEEIARVECLMVSKIGAPVTDPAIIQIRLATTDGIPVTRFKERAREIAVDRLGKLPTLVERLLKRAERVPRVGCPIGLEPPSQVQLFTQTASDRTTRIFDADQRQLRRMIIVYPKHRRVDMGDLQLQQDVVDEN